MTFFTYVYSPHHRTSCLHSFLFTFPKFYIIFILSSTPFPSCFCLVFFHLITEFELDFYDISNPQSQVRAMHFSSFTVWLSSIPVRPRLNKNKPKEDHELQFPLWRHFYFASHSIPTSFCLFSHSILTTIIHGESYGIFTNLSPSNNISVHLMLEPFSSVVTHFFH